MQRATPLRQVLAVLAGVGTGIAWCLVSVKWFDLPLTNRDLFIGAFAVGNAACLLVVAWRPSPGPRLSLRERLLLFFEPVNLDRVGTRPPPSGAGLAFAVSGLILGGLIFLGVLVMGIVTRDWTLVLSGGLMGVVCCALGVPAAHTLRRRRARRPGAP